MRMLILLAVQLMLMPPAPAAGQDITADPDAVRLVLEDVDRLARVLDELNADSDTSQVLAEAYLAEASPGLRAYMARYDLNPASLALAVARYPEAYHSLEEHSAAIREIEPDLREAFRNLRTFYPSAAFPPVWFIGGHHGPGGFTRQEGVVIAAERYVDRTADVVPLVLHELAHFQQAIVQGVEQYRKIYGPEQTLLALALREGTAELIAELTTGQHINPAAERYGLAHERTLWQEFRLDMHDRDPGEWMFVQPADDARPPDLGYWIGYRIARRYYEQAEDKDQAARDILGLRDYEAFLAQSGYGEQFEEQ